jgi:hypothetical protein
MKHRGTNLFAEYGKYGNGQNSIQLFDINDGMPWAVASVAIDQPLQPDEVAVKDYSENEGILETLFKAGVVEHPHRVVSSGFVIIPICKLKKP